MNTMTKKNFKINQSLLTCFLAVSVAKVAVTAAEPSAEPVYKIVSPVGESTAKMSPMARRLDTLEGKTVALVWNRAFKSDVTLPAIAEALKQKYPGIKIVQHSELPTAPLPETPGAPGRESSALVAEYKARGIQAVITGNGG